LPKRAINIKLERLPSTWLDFDSVSWLYADQALFLNPKTTNGDLATV